MAFGQCIKCPAKARPVRLYGIELNLCINHLNCESDADNRADNPKAQKEKHEQQESKEMKLWFTAQLQQCPKNCENCGKPIYVPKNLAPWSCVAHIVRKSTVPSVKMHPLNRWFACMQCHHMFDNWAVEKVMLMPVIAICKDRFNQFVNEINPSELKYVQPFLIPDAGDASHANKPKGKKSNRAN